MDPAERAQYLRQEIDRHRHLYYNEQAEISDAQYDALEAELRQLQIANPSLEDSTLQSVGAAPSGGFPPAKHSPPMLSLDKVHQPEDLTSWIKKQGGKELQLWPKFDGVSLSLTYERGQLVRAATRGDGSVGEEITGNVRALVSGIPHTLPEAWSGEVRGEVLMLLEDWKSYNEAHPSSPLANPRNATSGTLRAKDPATVSERRLCFYPYDLIGDGDKMEETLTRLGFKVEGARAASEDKEAIAYIEELQAGRQSLPYEVDGVVVRLRDRREYEKAGYTGHHPRGAIAYKLPSEEGESELLGVIWQVGKSGIVAPVGEITPLFLSGTTISRVSLHNLQIIAERDIRIGDGVRIKRAGDVIPHVIGPVDSASRSGKERKITPPKACPSCKGPLLEEGESKILRCENVQGCTAQQLRRLEHWASRSAADIDAIGSKWIARMAEEGLLSHPSDFYRLTKETLLQHFSGDGMREKLADKMIASARASREIGLRKALVGWSIPLASEGTAKRLCRAGYSSPEEIAAASVEELQETEDIGQMVATSLHEFFSLPATKGEIDELRSLGVNLDVLPEDGPVSSSSPLLGKRVVLTGTLSVPRTDFTQLLEGAGAEVSGSISKNTDYLVCGAGGGQKRKKAEALGVPLLSEEEARKMM